MAADKRRDRLAAARKLAVEAVARESPSVAALEARLEASERERVRLAKLLGFVEAYMSVASKPPEWMRPRKRLAPGAATACLHLSDLHLDEVVDPAELNGLNAFSRSIAEQRVRRWSEKACEMGDLHRHAWDGAIVFLGGDMVSGAIHDELVKTNEDELPGTMIYWAPRLAAAIKMVADFYGHVHCPAVVGNHGRLDQRMPAKRRARNSWDTLLYRLIALHLKDDPRITFDIASGSYLFVPVYNETAFLTHGDEVRGGSGWAGVWTPLGTILRRAVEIAPAHGKTVTYCVIGHWHRSILAHAQGIVLNNSLKGFDEYAASLRFRPEPPGQNWWVASPTHGTTLAAQLFVQDRRAEGW